MYYLDSTFAQRIGSAKVKSVTQCNLSEDICYDDDDNSVIIRTSCALSANTREFETPTYL